jgi:hypothetical protein
LPDHFSVSSRTYQSGNGLCDEERLLAVSGLQEGNKWISPARVLSYNLCATLQLATQLGGTMASSLTSIRQQLEQNDLPTTTPGVNGEDRRQVRRVGNALCRPSC